MQKFFVFLCLGVLCFSSLAGAKSIEVSSVTEAQNKSRALPEAGQAAQDNYANMTQDEFDAFLIERLKNAVITTLDSDNGAFNGASAVNVQQSDEYFKAQAEKNKTTFQKIYENALRRIDEQSGLQEQPQRSTVEAQNFVEEQRQEWQKAPDFAVVDVLLPPDNRKVAVPALEHIPFMHAQIEVLPSGVVSIEETIMVVANGEKLKHGLSRAVPKYVVSRNVERRPSDIFLNSVTINDRPIEYKLSATPDMVIFEPKYDFNLEPGIYTFKFSYILDRQIFAYEDAAELFWNVSGSSSNLIIARAGATIILPVGSEPLAQTAFSGYSTALSNENIMVQRPSPNVLGFITTEPLFLGEGFFVIVDMPKDLFTEVGFSKRFSWFISDFADVLFCGLALIMILLGYYISWRQMKGKNVKNPLSVPKQAALLRFLDKGGFDKTAFGGFLLELFKKNIIDIQQNDATVVLIKKTDNLSSLSGNERKAVNCLFINNEPVLYINEGNLLKLKRAYKFIEQQTASAFRKLSLKLNLTYLLFSFAMLLAAEGATAFLAINSMEIFYLLAATTLFLALCLVLFNFPYKNKWLRRLIKMQVSVLMFVAFCLMCLVISPWAALAIVTALLVMQFFTLRYSRRNGLVKGCIIEVENLKKYLSAHKEHIYGKEFLARQPQIFALELDADFPPTAQIKDFYRIDCVKEIVKKL